ncbi:unnamed protein product [Amoebophrya sp. A25]|nr:unnamed protein product [Amoebophrya sp. A25]|eukprot:GSA25T00025098001.1
MRLLVAIGRRGPRRPIDAGILLHLLFCTYYNLRNPHAFIAPVISTDSDFDHPNTSTTYMYDYNDTALVGL